MLKRAIPNVLTFSNLTFGVLSIVEVIQQNYIASAAFIMIAAFMDRYDGRIARRLDVCSDFGKELDSLADLVSFGVAPALLIFNKFNFLELNAKLVGLGVLVLYVLCGSYRLVRFNIIKFEGNFIGVPITVAGLALSAYSLLAPINKVSVFFSDWFTPFSFLLYGIQI
ncbi:CDP-diacylglycerol--serine O-phosphatidyltransferase [Cohnella rhizosphaerae]|uniref:CDP-diacylglycerol--serine O-phosphatidyltransferase n=1 Tax=Cohnella rhizosphaerae TaxID=1457232 RepID=A0A9X4KSY7_9BACL|nr:CDP-diacylglycerol--serine O-phosphatidyltransferase [Cohnella rhizosphaerae]MDG0810405.1 CDP-diacylglycerol--serine O-phosphatidyltransferase [Cohnella rhizosphaerae]